MVEIVLTARSQAGEEAIRKYHDERLSIYDRMRMKSQGIIGERRFVSESPVVHVTVVTVAPKHQGRIDSHFSKLSERIRLQYEAKMIGYGASLEDYDLQVKP